VNRAPFPPLISGADGLDVLPPPPTGLRQRLATLYGVPEACVLVTRDVQHGADLVLRRAVFDGARTFSGRFDDDLDGLAAVYRLTKITSDDADVCFQSKVASQTVDNVWRVIDERFAEYDSAPSFIADAVVRPKVVVLRSLTYAYGLAGAPCGAIIASPDTIERLAVVAEPAPLSTLVLRAATAALDPSRLPRTLQRIASVKAERARIAAELKRVGLPTREGRGPFVEVERADVPALTRFGIPTAADAGATRVLIRADRDANDTILMALGAGADANKFRRAEIVRDTKETRIVAAIDLDAPGAVQVETGIGFLDHMFAQVAQHGGFSLTLTCNGDLEIDAHHTIEDCALAFGQALSAALGDKKGIARFGFLLPMDETEAQVSLDLSGRPYAVFDGAFSSPLLGVYPTEMTEHVFRSLAQTLGAAIHVKVSGDNDHHKTEACFKALGRALRQAVRIEGEDLPSTKGTL
jgi:imidazoleglycerol-phosphate dehydratase / histidinol-phosphatase